MRLSDLAVHAGTELAEVVRDCEVETAELCADIRGTAVLTFLEKEKFLPCLEHPGITAVICTRELADKLPAHIPGLLLSDAPKFAFYSLYNFLAQAAPQSRVPTRVGEGADIAPTAYVAPYNVEIGKNSVIGPGAVIQEHVTIGDNVSIGAGTVVGVNSFSPARYRDRAITLRDQGSVVIGNHVELCGNCAIARGVFPGDITRLADGVKSDLMVYVGHNSQIGRKTFLAAGAKIPGNVWIGEDVWIGVNATISNRIRIGDGARVSLGSVVTKDVPAGATVSGNFAIDHQRFLKNLKASLRED